MKKCVHIIFILIFTLFPVFSDEVIITTEEGDKILIVPENPEELKEAFIEMAILYIGEEIDHRKSLDKIDRLLKVIEGHQTNEDEYDDIIDLKDEVIKEADKTVIYKSGVVFGCDFPIFINRDFQFKFGYRGVILDKFTFDTIINFPSIGIGIIFGIFL